MARQRFCAIALTVLGLGLAGESLLAQEGEKRVFYDDPYPIEPSSPNLHAYVMIQIKDSAGIHHVFAYDWSSREKKEVFKYTCGSKHEYEHVQVAPIGNAVYVALDNAWTGYGDSTYNGSIMVWDGRAFTKHPSLKEREVESMSGDGTTYRMASHIPTPILSPDGKSIVMYDNCFYEYVDSWPGIGLNHQRISALRFGEASLHYVIDDTLESNGMGAGEEYIREVIHFSLHMPSVVYTHDFISGQLHSTHRNLCRLDLRTGQYQLVDSQIELFLDASIDDRLILYTNDDETCCGGSNYTDNLLILYDTKLQKRVLLYDEYVRYHNKGKEDDYEPSNGAISPDNQWIASTVGDSILAFSTDGKLQRQFGDRKLLGWVDSTHFLCWPESQTVTSGRLQTTHGSMRVIDISTAQEEELFPKQMEFMSIVWQ